MNQQILIALIFSKGESPCPDKSGLGMKNEGKVFKVFFQIQNLFLVGSRRHSVWNSQ